MRLLVDECCDASITAHLRQAGHDVIAVVEAFPSSEDVDIAAFARDERRVVITEDYDFGEIAVRYSGLPDGVVLIDPPSTKLDDRAGLVARFLALHGGEIQGRLAILKGSRIRWRDL